MIGGIYAIKASKDFDPSTSGAVAIFFRVPLALATLVISSCQTKARRARLSLSRRRRAVHLIKPACVVAQDHSSASIEGLLNSLQHERRTRLLTQMIALDERPNFAGKTTQVAWKINRILAKPNKNATTRRSRRWSVGCGLHPSGSMYRRFP